MDIIVLAAIVAAVLLGEAAAAAVIALMMAGGEALEAWAEGRARPSLSDLIARAPRRAARLGDGGIEEIVVEANRPRDLLPVRPSETVAADGTLAPPAIASDLPALAHGVRFHARLPSLGQGGYITGQAIWANGGMAESAGSGGKLRPRRTG